MSVFAAAALAPRDPILGLNEQFNADTRTDKVNLGVGVYTDAQGKLPLLDCVRSAESRLAAAPSPRGYLPIDGLPGYVLAAQRQVFGSDAGVLAQRRMASLQSLGGTGALKVGADFLKRLQPQARAWISDPSWENHRALFSSAGFEVLAYPYYDAAVQGVAFERLLHTLQTEARAGDVVVLHACCHNPTGYDLSDTQWQQLVPVLQQRGLIPFVDMAYQGLRRRPDRGCIRREVAGGCWSLLPGRQQLQQELLSLRRTGRQPARGVWRRRRGPARAESAQGERTNQLLQPAHPWRQGGGHRAERRRLARAVGDRAECDARAHRFHAGWDWSLP
jgi:aromatic-amino-acid transaminase